MNASDVFLRLQLLELEERAAERFLEALEGVEDCENEKDDLELPATLRASDGVCARSLSSSNNSSVFLDAYGVRAF